MSFGLGRTYIIVSSGHYCFRFEDWEAAWITGDSFPGGSGKEFSYGGDWRVWMSTEKGGQALYGLAQGIESRKKGEISE